jgi:hypothetical protein
MPLYPAKTPSQNAMRVKRHPSLLTDESEVEVLFLSNSSIYFEPYGASGNAMETADVIPLREPAEAGCPPARWVD